MDATTVEELVTTINELSNSDRAELLRRLSQPQPKNGEVKNTVTNGKKGYVNPNTIWIRENSHRYRGQYVAIKDGEFIASGRTLKDADIAARSLGVTRPLLHYVMAEGEIAYCGIIE